MTNRTKWIVGGVFWILFILSLALYQSHRWVDRVWSAAMWMFLSALCIYFVARAIRNRAIKGGGSYPQWFVRLAYDDSDRKERPVKYKAKSRSLSKSEENVAPSKDMNKLQS